MDRTLACEAENLGSTPNGCTQKYDQSDRIFLIWRGLTFFHILLFYNLILSTVTEVNMFISQPPDWAKPFIVEEGVLEVDGAQYGYHVLSPDLDDLKYFIGFSKNAFLFISAEVPEAFRDHILRHEVREFVQRAGQKGRCVQTLRQELEEVPRAILVGYVEFRHQQFRGLVAYYAGQEGHEELKEELAGSLAYLNHFFAGIG